MKINSVLIIQAIACLTTAIPTTIKSAVNEDWDAVVVGGGPAGLSAASALGRVRRKALLIDSGDYRNQVTRRVHDVIGYDGVTPAYFRWKARRQISAYDTVHLTNGTVDKIEPQANNTYFTITSRYENGTEYCVTARKIILATGLRDILPSTPGVQENWGKGIFWCPWCDGHEHEDQPLGILGPLGSSGNTPLEILSLNTDIILFVNGTDTPEQRAIVDGKLPKWDKWFDLHNIPIENRTITSLERLRDGANFEEDPSKPTHPEYDLFRVHFEDGPSTNRSAFITNFPSEQSSKLGEQTGVAVYGGKLEADLNKGMISNIPGVYVVFEHQNDATSTKLTTFQVGDCNLDNSTNVPHAMWSGKRAVVSLHVKLETENALSEISALSRRDELSERALWADVNGPDDVLDAGEFDQ